MQPDANVPHVKEANFPTAFVCCRQTTNYIIVYQKISFSLGMFASPWCKSICVVSPRSWCFVFFLFSTNNFFLSQQCAISFCLPLQRWRTFFPLPVADAVFVFFKGHRWECEWHRSQFFLLCYLWIISFSVYVVKLTSNRIVLPAFAVFLYYFFLFCFTTMTFVRFVSAFATVCLVIVGCRTESQSILSNVGRIGDFIRTCINSFSAQPHKTVLNKILNILLCQQENSTLFVSAVKKKIISEKK